MSRPPGAARPKGFHPWKPYPHVLKLIEQVQEVLDEYALHLPLTVRQVFYRLVGQYGYEKSDRSYKRLIDNLVRARRAQMIPFHALRDDSTIGRTFGGYDSLAEFWEGELAGAEAYVRDRMEGQSHRMELWCEATGMVPQLARVASEFQVPVYSAKGFSSITTTHQIAQRAINARDKDGKPLPTTFLHVGDFDPSGQSIYEVMVEDAGKFAAQLGGEPITPVRVALTPKQVDKYKLPTAPVNENDTRSRTWEGETCQAEAMAPDDLAKIVKKAITSRLDMKVRKALLEVEAREHDEVVGKVGAFVRSATGDYGFPLEGMNDDE